PPSRYLRLSPPPTPPLFPYTTLFRSEPEDVLEHDDGVVDHDADHQHEREHGHAVQGEVQRPHHAEGRDDRGRDGHGGDERRAPRSEEHTSELQSLTNLVCRLLLEKKT